MHFLADSGASPVWSLNLPVIIPELEDVRKGGPSCSAGRMLRRGKLRRLVRLTFISGRLLTLIPASPLSRKPVFPAACPAKL